MNRREIFAGNWKMNHLFADAEGLVSGLAGKIKSMKNREVVVFPPMVYLREMVKLCKSSGISVGAQNMYFEEEGAFTGEISPGMIVDAGAKYVLIGHSERRHVFGESNEDVTKKVRAAFSAGLEPVVCVGELLEEREAGKSEFVVKEQIRAAVNGLSAGEIEKTVIAYEPVWAIGTGKTATPEIAESMHLCIRETIADAVTSQAAEIIPILYGGSVKPDNISGLYKMQNIDGTLVGGASLKAGSFLDIVNVQ